MTSFLCATGMGMDRSSSMSVPGWSEEPWGPPPARTWPGSESSTHTWGGCQQEARMVWHVG